MIFERFLICLHFLKSSGLFRGLAFIHPITAIWKAFKSLWLAGKKAGKNKMIIMKYSIQNLCVTLTNFVADQKFYQFLKIIW